MTKLVLGNVSSGYGTVDVLNANFDAIEAAFDNTLSRDGDSPNPMLANLDMNGFLILNQANPITVEGFNWEGQWLTATSYQVGDVVQYDGASYICIVEHISGTFTTDLAAMKWQVVCQASLPSQIGNSGEYLTTNGVAASWGELLYTPAGAGAVVTPVQNKLRESVSLADFNADPTGVADSTAAIQAFFNQAIAVGGDCIIPKGTYRVSSTIQIYETAPQRHDGARIKGSGINETIIDFRGSGRIFDIRGIPASNGTGTQSGTYFIWGLELSGMTLNGANKTGTTDAIRLVGVWNSTFDNLTIKNVRHGIVSDGDLTYNTNPDWSSTTNCRVTRCNFERLTSYGFYNTQTQAAPGWVFSESLFVLCGDGGIRLASGGVSIKQCGFSGCGWSSEVATPNINGAGILFSGAVTATSQISVENCEFDTNFTAHVDMEYAGSVRFSGNRYIFNDRYSYGSVCPTAAAVRIAAFGVNNSVQNCTFTNETFRLDPGPTTGTPTCFLFSQNTNVQNIRAIGALFSDSNGTLNFTKVAGHTPSNFWIRNNYQLELSDVTDLTYTLPGRPFAEYLGTISGTPVTTGGNTLTVLKFNSQETVNNQIFGTSLYNTTTGVFTCPVAGYYDIDFIVALVSTISTDLNAIRIYKNGSFLNEWPGAGTGGTRTLYQGRYRVFCNATDTLDIREVCSVSRTITGNYSYLRISLAR